MKSKLQLATFIASFLTFHSVFGQGALTPSSAPAPTMKSLDQIEARIPISSAPYNILRSGSYYLTGNLTVAGGNAITITTNNVTLDLNGYSIASTEPVATTNSAILLSGGRMNVAIANGHISSSVTNDSLGVVFGGSGFGYGIFVSSGNCINVRVKNVSVTGVLKHGIYLTPGLSAVVEYCTVYEAGSYGIFADSVSDSSAANCGNTGIVAEDAYNCKGVGIGFGVGLNATTANNCSGTGTGSGHGLIAITANNCSGICSGAGVGVSATTANNCFGQSSTGTGLSVTIANSCVGQTASAGTGLFAFIANGCHGVASGGTPLVATHNVNSF